MAEAAKPARAPRRNPAPEIAEKAAPEVAERTAEQARAASPAAPKKPPKQRWRERMQHSRPDLDDDALENLWAQFKNQTPEGAELAAEGRKLSER